MEVVRCKRIKLNIAYGDHHPVDNQPQFWREDSNRMLLHPPLGPQQKVGKGRNSGRKVGKGVRIGGKLRVRIGVDIWLFLPQVASLSQLTTKIRLLLVMDGEVYDISGYSWLSTFSNVKRDYICGQVFTISHGIKI